MKADSMMCSGRSLCPIPRELPSNENCLDDRPERAGRLFLLTGCVCVYRYFPASHWLLYVHGRTFLRAGIGGTFCIFCVCSMSLPFPGAGRLKSSLVRRTTLWHQGTVGHHAGDDLAGDSREIPCQL